jgi:adenylate cyclase
MAGMTLWFMAGEQKAAANIVDRALALNPNSAYAWNASGWLVALQNQPSPAIEAFQRAIRLSPFDPLGWMFAGGLAVVHFFARQLEEAIEWSDRALQGQPRWVIAVRLRMVACAYLGRTEEARDGLGRCSSFNPGRQSPGGSHPMRRLYFRRNYSPFTWRASARPDCRRSEAQT